MSIMTSYPQTYADAVKMAFQFQFEVFFDIGVASVYCHPGITGRDLTVYFQDPEELEMSFLFCVQKSIYPEVPSPIESLFNQEGGGEPMWWHKERESL